MLSLFEQNCFVEEKYIKRYPYTITNKNIKKMLNTLEYAAADPVKKKLIEEEYYALINETVWKSQNAILSNQLAAQSNQLAAQSNQLAAQSDGNAVLLRLVQQAGITIPPEYYSIINIEK
jgi:hypothetical protein